MFPFHPRFFVKFKTSGIQITEEWETGTDVDVG
jgi:hypothetical protein